MSRHLLGTAVLAALGLCAAIAQAQTPVAAPPRAPNPLLPGPPKNAPPPKPVKLGPYAVTIRTEPSLPTHTVYRPVDLDAFAGGKLPIVAWANGGCINVGRAHQNFLYNIASHGYLVVAVGPADAKLPVMTLDAQGRLPPIGQSGPEVVVAGIDWAVKQNGLAASPYAGRIATKKIAVMGQSCGGLQSILVAADPRIVTNVVWNSGVQNPGARVNLYGATKESLAKLHAPVAYFLGGPSDTAYANGEDDYTRITVPVFKGNLNVGHGGTYGQPNGGWFAEVGAAWLDWQVKGDAEAGKWFTGADCGLCKEKDWKIEKKGIP